MAVPAIPETKKKTDLQVEAWVTKADLIDQTTTKEMVVVDLTNSTIETIDHHKITVVVVVDHMTTIGTAVMNQETGFKEDSVTVTTIKEDLIMIRGTTRGTTRGTKNITVVRLAKTTTEMMIVVVVATSEIKEEVEAVNLTEAHLDNIKIVETVRIDLTEEDQISARDLNTAVIHEVKQLLSSQRLFKLNQTSST